MAFAIFTKKVSVFEMPIGSTQLTPGIPGILAIKPAHANRESLNDGYLIDQAATD